MRDEQGLLVTLRRSGDLIDDSLRGAVIAPGRAGLDRMRNVRIHLPRPRGLTALDDQKFPTLERPALIWVKRREHSRSDAPQSSSAMSWASESWRHFSLAANLLIHVKADHVAAVSFGGIG